MCWTILSNSFKHLQNFKWSSNLLFRHLLPTGKYNAQPKENKTCPILIPFVCDDANNHFYRNSKSLPWDKFNQKKMLGGWIKPCLVAQEAQGRLKVAPKSILDRAQPLKAPIQPLSLRPTCVPRIPPTHLYKYILHTHQSLIFYDHTFKDTTKYNTTPLKSK